MKSHAYSVHDIRGQDKAVHIGDNVDSRSGRQQYSFALCLVIDYSRAVEKPQYSGELFLFYEGNEVISADTTDVFLFVVELVGDKSDELLHYHSALFSAYLLIDKGKAL